MSKTKRANVSLRPSELVIAAIHNLEERKGSSSNDIIDFIADKYNLHADQVRGHVEKALKRGVYFGVLAENDGLYQLLDMGSGQAGVSGGKKLTPQAGPRRKRVTIKVPPGKASRRTAPKVKRKTAASTGAKRKSGSGKPRNVDVSKKCCVMKMVRGRKQKLSKAMQQKKIQQQRRKKFKQRVT